MFLMISYAVFKHTHTTCYHYFDRFPFPLNNFLLISNTHNHSVMLFQESTTSNLSCLPAFHACVCMLATHPFPSLIIPPCWMKHAIKCRMFKCSLMLALPKMLGGGKCLSGWSRPRKQTIEFIVLLEKICTARCLELIKPQHFCLFPGGLLRF